MNLFDLYATLTLDTSGYEKSVDAAGQSSERLEADMQSLQNVSDAMHNRVSVLNSRFEEQKQKLDELSKKLNESTEASGATSQETQNLANEFAKAQQKVEATGRQLVTAAKESAELDGKLADMRQKAAEAALGVGDLGETTGKITEKSSLLTKVLTGVNAGAKAVSSGLATASSAVGALSTTLGKQVPILPKVSSGLQAISDIVGKFSGCTSFEQLTGTIKEQSAKVQELKQKYMDAYLANGKFSKSAIAAAAELQKESTQLGKNEAKLQKAEQAANKFDKEEQALAKNTKNQGDKAEEAAEKNSKLGDVLKGGLVAGAKAAAAGLAAAATAVVALTKSAVENYANYEQLAGGVETLFGSGGMNLQEYAASQGKAVSDVSAEFAKLTIAEQDVFNNANNAYKTVGLSANEYMETVTSFAASLNQSLGGDTVAAAQKADLALTDMADNANKMGTDMQSIQNAYGGFAKQNYTMLDNLKLGYGGTKEEMQRLLADAQAISGVEYDISSYADIVDAIHVVQTEMGITGTTAKEASSTIQGSVNMTKAAWSNLLTGLADENADFSGLVTNLVESATTAFGNIAPRVMQALNGISLLIEEMVPIIVEQIPPIIASVAPGMLSAATELFTGLLDGLMLAIPGLMPVALDLVLNLATYIVEALPALLQTGLEIIVALVNGISESLPTLIPTIVDVIIEIADVLTDPGNLSMIIESALVLIIALAEGLIAAMPKLIKKVPELVQNLVTAIVDNAPKLLNSAGELIDMLVQGFSDNLPSVFKSGGDIIVELINGCVGLLGDLFGLGEDVVQQIEDGISAAWDGLVNWFSGIWDSLFGNRSVNVNVNKSSSGGTDGSHANGLSYVPYDGYVAELHRGEMVVPAAQAQTLRSGDSGETDAILRRILMAIEDGNEKETVLKVNNREFGRAVKGALYA